MNATPRPPLGLAPWGAGVHSGAATASGIPSQRAAGAARERKGRGMMRKVLFWLIATAMVASVVASVFAGGHECQISAEECAKQLRAKFEKTTWLGIEKEKTPEGAVEFGKGDLVRFSEGLDCTWTVIEKVRKKYSFR